MAPRIVVVGAGISGLAVTFNIQERIRDRGLDAEVLCLEASDRPGGNIRTTREEGLVCEWGPNGFLDNEPATRDLIRRAGIEQRLLVSNESAAKRFIFRNGKLNPVSGSPLTLLRSGFLSLPGKLRCLCEPMARSKRDETDESVFDFASRRIGREAAEILVDAMVSGVFAGDARRLSLRAAFPKMWQMEHDHGSLFRAMLARKKEARATGRPTGGPSGPAGSLMSFKNGMQELVDGLAAKVGPSLRLNTPVERLADMGVRGFRLYPGEGAPMDIEGVVLACPAWYGSELVSSFDPEMATPMAEIPSSPVAVVHLVYEESALGGAPDGFGFLVPRGQHPRILGALWSSSIFQGRAPTGQALITCMIGGAQDPEALAMTDEELVATARADLGTAMEIVVAPRVTRVFRHPRGIPHYTVGHPDRVRAIERRLEAHPGLLVSGNSYRGISVNACAAEALAVAESALRRLGVAETRRAGATE
jgi:oxygen-dependent protoporphyrinogen oxidase